MEDTLMSDHRIAVMKTSLKTSETKRTLEKDSFAALDFRHKNTDWNAIHEATMNADWFNIFKNKTSDDIYNILHVKLLEICTQYTPVRRRCTKNSIPRDRRILMRKRTKINKIMAKTINTYEIGRLKDKIKDIEVKLAQSLQEN